MIIFKDSEKFSLLSFFYVILKRYQLQEGETRKKNKNLKGKIGAEDIVGISIDYGSYTIYVYNEKMYQQMKTQKM